MNKVTEIDQPVEELNQHSAADHAANQPSSCFALGQEPWRPKVHFTPARMWINDPNGMIFHNGLYHLFYQYHPGSMIWGPMHWGHATTKDLLNWQEHKIALYPDQHGAMFSGCCVNDRANSCGLFAGHGDDNLVAVFSHEGQTQGIATSTNGGFDWTQYAGNPVLGAVKKDFRDPKVFWHADTNRWIMAISAHKECQFYASVNLIDWTFQSAFSGGSTVGVWEVPDLFQLPGPDGTLHWVLLMSVNDGAPAGGSGVEYFIGDFDGQAFHWDPTHGIGWLDYGPDNYAGTTWYDEPSGDKLYIGWMSNWRYANHVPTDPWRGCMTLPRSLALFDNGQGLEVGGFPKAWPEQSITGVRVQEITFSRHNGNLQTLGLEVDGRRTGHELTINFAAQTLTLSRPQALPTMLPCATMPLAGLDLVRTKLVYDNGIVELFDLDTGRAISQVSFGTASQ